MQAAALAFAILIASVGTAAASCNSSFAGTWRGTQTDVGGSQRAITITMRPDCSYTWVTSRTTTEGQITGSGQQMGYRNAAGSVGSVTGNNQRLTFRHFRDNYTVAITRR
ncbi:hypothetical protein [Phreatobacter sp.]|uniref:hypothetical protein n=1 Tax=Phreatobacter sp. TaxID=1966341 RepID=UPI0025E3B92B|nr:hypothetical protein [Phreatobacter sp.]